MHASTVPSILPRLNWPVLAIFAGYIALVWVLFQGFPSPDLYALYLAAFNVAQGDWSMVYAAPGDLFDLAVPSAWDAQATSAGITDRPLYPYIYPPLWAAAFAPITQITGPAAFDTAALLINAGLLAFGTILAHRVVRPNLSLPIWMLVSLGFVTLTSFGNIALQQNQPQILVSILILLALERDRSSSPITAGIALALAASIKLYPVLFILFWVASQNWRATLSFIITGAALGLTSIALAGWPTHALFLDHISTISNTLLASQINLNIDATLAQAFAVIDMIRAGTLTSTSAGAFIAGAKPDAIVVLDGLALLAGLALAFVAIRRADDQTRFTAIYPATIAFVAFVSPLTWTHHYLPAILMLPLILDRKNGWVILASLAILFSRPLLIVLDSLPSPVFLAQILGTVGIVAILILFLRPNSKNPQLST